MVENDGKHIVIETYQEARYKILSSCHCSVFRQDRRDKCRSLQQGDEGGTRRKPMNDQRRSTTTRVIPPLQSRSDDHREYACRLYTHVIEVG